MDFDCRIDFDLYFYECDDLPRYEDWDEYRRVTPFVWDEPVLVGTAKELELVN